MKTSTLPSLRVTPELRSAAEAVLLHGETLSGFIEESLRAQIERRRNQQEFIARGRAARDEAQASGDYMDKAEVMHLLSDILERQRKAP